MGAIVCFCGIHIMRMCTPHTHSQHVAHVPPQTTQVDADAGAAACVPAAIHPNYSTRTRNYNTHSQADAAVGCVPGAGAPRPRQNKIDTHCGWMSCLFLNRPHIDGRQPQHTRTTALEHTIAAARLAAGFGATRPNPLNPLEPAAPTAIL